jgi:pyruvate dehydrogenase E2 component (dihydrolipoamide acetyltransferase)
MYELLVLSRTFDQRALNLQREGRLGTYATPIISYHDVAILGTGRITERPWVKAGQIVIRKILPLSSIFDHRVTDGVDAAKFLIKVTQYLDDPALLFLESA